MAYKDKQTLIQRFYLSITIFLVTNLEIWSILKLYVFLYGDCFVWIEVHIFYHENQNFCFVKPFLTCYLSDFRAEPMKKRKKTDPGMLLAKENKKIKKLEKDMKRLSRYGRKLKPVEEIIGTVYVRRNAEWVNKDILSFISSYVKCWVSQQGYIKFYL